MSDQTERPLEARLEPGSEHLKSREVTETPLFQSSFRSGIVSLLAFLLALVAFGIASWLAYENYKATQLGAQVDPILARVARIETGIETLGNELLEVEGRVAEKNAEMNARRTAHKTQVQQLLVEFSESLMAIQNRMGASSQDWVYAEIEYLIRMANQRALMEQDVYSALQLLQSADDIIRASEGLTAHGLREALARDIAALQVVASPDTQGIYLELSALVSQIPLLSRSLPAYQAPTSAKGQSPDATGYLDRFLDLISRAQNKLLLLVDFRRHEVTVKPILPPKEEYFLRQNLVLKLQIAQMALLEGNQSLFQSALGEALVWVSDSFDRKNPGTVAMMESIIRLSALQVSVDLPDITSSLKAARSQIAGLKEARLK